MAKHNETGVIGEAHAAAHLVSLGYEIVNLNVRYKYGEIDIVARESVRMGYVHHFVEVKTVARGKSGGSYHPLQNISREKLSRLRRAISTYIVKNGVGDRWQFDALCVFMPIGKPVVCELYQNQII